MRRFFSLLAVLFLLVVSAHARADVPSAPTGKPSAADEASAKKQFENGLKLYGEGAYDGALIAFETSYKLGGRAVALKNVAQAHRAMKHFVDAYEAYETLLERHDAQLGAPDKTAVKQALEELSILSGTLLVNVSEADATIEIDGKAVGKSPMAKPKRVSVAAHQVRVTKPSFEKHEESVNVGSQEAKKLDIKLEIEKNTGRIAVREQSGRDVHVFVDGVDKGAAPFEGDIAAGEHTIEVKGPRFASEPRKVVIVAKERSDIAFDATSLTGRLRITTVPASATIAVDGKAMGTGAWEGELPEGAHKIEVTLGDAAPQVREIVLARGQLVVQEIAIASAVGARVEEYEGLYGKFTTAAGFALSGLASNDVPGTTTPSDRFLIMPTAMLRIGKSFGWLAGEVVAAVAFEHRHEEVEFVEPNGNATIRRHPRIQSNAMNGFIGVGPRVTSKNDSVRFTFAIAPGIAIRTFVVQTRRDDNVNGPDPNNNTRFGPSSQGGSGENQVGIGDPGYQTLGFVGDGGILLGSTPGTKFFVGLHYWIDFPPEIVAGPDPNFPAHRKPGRGLIVVDSVQFYVGPSIGLQFGH